MRCFYLMETTIMSYNKIEPNFNQYLTRREVCQLLKISLPTLDRLTRSGAIKGYRFKNGVDGGNKGYMIRYKANEIEQSLTQMMTGL